MEALGKSMEALNSVQVCEDRSDCEELLASAGLFLKPEARIGITVALPKLKMGQSISNNEIVEKLRSAIKPVKFVYIKVTKSSLEFIRFDAEISNRSYLETVVQKIDLKGIKLNGFSELLKIRAAEAKTNFPTRHDWNSFFRDAKNMNEMKPGERPDTVLLKGLPIRWFSQFTTNNRPSDQLIHKIMSQYGEIRYIDIPSNDPLRHKMSATISGLTPALLSSKDFLFNVYVQYREYVGFDKCMREFQGKKLVYVEDDKAWSCPIEIDFDRTKHLTDYCIKKRKEEREKLLAIDKEREERERKQKELLAKARQQERDRAQAALQAEQEQNQQRLKDKIERRKRREQLRRERKLRRQQEKNRDSDDQDELLGYKIAKEERKLRLAQRKLESIRLLDELFDRIRVVRQRGDGQKKKDDKSKQGEEEQERVMRSERVSCMKQRTEAAIGHHQRQMNMAQLGQSRLSSVLPRDADNISSISSRTFSSSPSHSDDSKDNDKNTYTNSSLPGPPPVIGHGPGGMIRPPVGTPMGQFTPNWAHQQLGPRPSFPGPINEPPPNYPSYYNPYSGGPPDGKVNDGPPMMPFGGPPSMVGPDGPHGPGMNIPPPYFEGPPPDFFYRGRGRADFRGGWPGRGMPWGPGIDMRGGGMMVMRGNFRGRRPFQHYGGADQMQAQPLPAPAKSKPQNSATWFRKAAVGEDSSSSKSRSRSRSRRRRRSGSSRDDWSWSSRSRSRSKSRKRSRSRSRSNKSRSRSSATDTNRSKERDRRRCRRDERGSRSSSRKPRKETKIDNKQSSAKSRSQSRSERRLAGSRTASPNKNTAEKSARDADARKSSRSRSRSRSKDHRSNSRSRNKSRSRSKGKNRSRSRSKSEDRSHSRSKSKDKSRSRSESKNRSRSRSKSKNRSRSRSKSKDRSRSRSRSKSRSRSRSKSKSRSRSISKSKSRSRSRSKSSNKSRSRSKSMNRSHSRNKSKDRSRSRSKGRDRSSSRNKSRDISRTRSKSRDSSCSRSKRRKNSRSQSRDRRRRSRSASSRSSRSHSHGRRRRSKSKLRSRSRSHRRNKSREKRASSEARESDLELSSEPEENKQNNKMEPFYGGPPMGNFWQGTSNEFWGGPPNFDANYFMYHNMAAARGQFAFNRGVRMWIPRQRGQRQFGGRWPQSYAPRMRGNFNNFTGGLPSEMADPFIDCPPHIMQPRDPAPPLPPLYPRDDVDDSEQREQQRLYQKYFRSLAEKEARRRDRRSRSQEDTRIRRDESHERIVRYDDKERRSMSIGRSSDRRRSCGDSAEQRRDPSPFIRKRLPLEGTRNESNKHLSKEGGYREGLPPDQSPEYMSKERVSGRRVMPPSDDEDFGAELPPHLQSRVSSAEGRSIREKSRVDVHDEIMKEGRMYSDKMEANALKQRVSRGRGMRRGMPPSHYSEEQVKRKARHPRRSASIERLTRPASKVFLAREEGESPRNRNERNLYDEKHKEESPRKKYLDNPRETGRGRLYDASRGNRGRVRGLCRNEYDRRRPVQSCSDDEDRFRQRSPQGRPSRKDELFSPSRSKNERQTRVLQSPERARYDGKSPPLDRNKETEFYKATNRNLDDRNFRDRELSPSNKTKRKQVHLRGRIANDSSEGGSRVKESRKRGYSSTVNESSLSKNRKLIQDLENRYNEQEGLLSDGSDDVEADNHLLIAAKRTKLTSEVEEASEDSSNDSDASNGEYSDDDKPNKKKKHKKHSKKKKDKRSKKKKKKTKK